MWFKVQSFPPNLNWIVGASSERAREPVGGGAEIFEDIRHYNLCEMQKFAYISSLDPHLIIDFLTLSFESGRL